MTSPRYRPEHRKQLILSAALRLADHQGYRNILLPDVASEAHCTTGLVSHYFDTIENLRCEVLREAIRCEHIRVVAQGISHLDPITVDVPHDLRWRAGQLIARGGDI